MRTFSILTLGCKVNQYESQQIASLLRSRGLVQIAHATAPEAADLRIIHTCSVTNEAAAQSRQAARRLTGHPQAPRPRVVITGCWATSNPDHAAALPGIDAVITHNQNIAQQLHLLLDQWQAPQPAPVEPGLPTRPLSLPLLDSHQIGHQRAIMKIQDGCDAMCTYCIIPRLRPRLWSKPLDQAVREAQALVDAGHLEIVLTGIFLSAYGQSTALRRRQSDSAHCLPGLVEALCRRVRGLARLRLSSLEPGDLTPRLLSVLRSHAQVVPHFHLPLQSGSDAILRRMNRQYRRDDFLQMIDAVRNAFDRPALTTDIIVAFPGETAGDFARTLDIVDRCGFIHIHAFPFSPRPGTAAARWKLDAATSAAASDRLAQLQQRAQAHSFSFRRQFLNHQLQLLVERSSPRDAPWQYGRCDRYFPVHFLAANTAVGTLVNVRIDQVTPQRSVGLLS